MHLKRYHRVRKVKIGESVYRTSDFTLYALWKDDLPLTFHSNGGSGSDFTQTVAYNLSLGAYKLTFPENSFTKEGYAFAGWGTSSSTKYASAAAGEEKSVSESTTDYYAIWASSSVTVTFDANSANGGSGSSFTQNFAFDSESLNYTGTMPANSFTNENGNFVGWAAYKKPSSTSSILEGGKSFEISLAKVNNYKDNDGTITLYAVWNPKTFTVTYNTMGNGENIVDVVKNTAGYGESMSYTVRSTAAQSEYGYYTFLGWGAYSTSTSYIGGSTISLSGNKTIYAVWKLGTIREDTDWVSISKSTKRYFEIKLLYQTKLDISAEGSGELEFDLISEASLSAYLSGGTFSRYSAVSADNAKSVSGSVTLVAGTYYYCVENQNILLSKNFKLTIKPAE